MSTVNLVLGAKNKIATVTATDANGEVIPADELTITCAVATAGIVAESATTYGNGQFGATAVGSTDVTWSAQLTEAAGGGPAVAAPSDTLVVERAPIQSVAVVYTDSPV